MMYGFGPNHSRSTFLPTEFDLPTDMHQAVNAIKNRENLTANLLNTKENGQYTKTETLTGQQWFFDVEQMTGSSTQNRIAFRKVFDVININGGNFIGAGATVSVGHGITGITASTRIYGSATTGNQTYIPIPYASATANLNIELFADQNNITVINGAGQPELIQLYVVWEYLKQG